MESKVLIAKLNNINYPTWKFKMQMILIKENVWNAISGNIPEEPDAYTMWQRSDELARALIALNIEDSQLSLIMDKNTSKLTWEALKDFHEKASTFNRMRTMRKMFETKMNEFKSMENHVEEMSAHLNRLRDLEVNGFDHDSVRVSLLLSSLPESYNTLITALEVRPESELTWPIVTSKLLEEYHRRNMNGNNDEKLLVIGANSGNQRNGKNEGLFCRYCKRNNHIIEDCRILKSKNKNKSDSINKVEEDTDEKLFTIQSILSNDWILDTGASSYFSSNRKLFDSIRKTNQFVKVANGSRLKVHGIGRLHN